MTKTLGKSLLMIVALFMTAGAVAAHHGTASFDRTRVTMLKGTVTEFIWTNPHGGIDFDVKDSKGVVEKWMGFLTSPNWLARAGWNKNTLKPGDKILISGNPSKNHAYSLWITKVQLADGQELPVAGPENFQ